MLHRPLKHQYDEEATKLARVHQLEFPGYRYQPKKRFHSDSQQPTTTPYFQVSSQSSGSSSSYAASSPNLNQHYLSPVVDNQPHQYRQRFASATNGDSGFSFQSPVRAESCLILSQHFGQKQPPRLERLVPVIVKCGDVVSEFHMSLPVEQPQVPAETNMVFLVPIETEFNTTLEEGTKREDEYEEVSVDQVPVLFNATENPESNDNIIDDFEVDGQFGDLLRSIDINEILTAEPDGEFREEEDHEELFMDILNSTVPFQQLLKVDIDYCLSNLKIDPSIIA